MALFLARLVQVHHQPIMSEFQCKIKSMSKRSSGSWPASKLDVNPSVAEPSRAEGFAQWYSYVYKQEAMAT